MTDLVDIVGLGPIIERVGGNSATRHFEALYDDLATSGQHEALVSEIEEKTREYFDAVQLPDITTVYDYLLLSLRPKDLIATFNWDPLLVQAFRRHEGLISMPQLAFLHGNVAIGFCDRDGVIGWHDDRCRECNRPFSPSPLLFPVRSKDYTSRPAIRSQWALLEHVLEEAYFVTIFGYSAPATDAAARGAMLRVWSRNRAREMAQIEIIDIRSGQELRCAWEEFIGEGHYIAGSSVMRGYTSWHPRRSCDALFAATGMNNPWKDDWLPQFPCPVDLRRWLDPLWKEERELGRCGSRFFSGRPCREWHGRDT